MSFILLLLLPFLSFSPPLRKTFTGELYGGGGGGYGAPNGMDFDGSDNQVQDDPRLHDYNLDQMIETFVKDAQDQAAHTRTEHIMWAMGSDFNYQVGGRLGRRTGCRGTATLLLNTRSPFAKHALPLSPSVDHPLSRPWRNDRTPVR